MTPLPFLAIVLVAAPASAARGPKVSADADAAVRRAWLGLPGRAGGCELDEHLPYEYFPNGGLLSFYCHARTLLDLPDLERLSRLKAFLSGPHRDRPVQGITNDFGRYDPRFVRWARAALLPARRDAAFREQTQLVYDRYVAPAARVFRAVRVRLASRPALLAREIADVRSALARRDLPERWYERFHDLIDPQRILAQSGEGREGADALLDGGALDGAVVSTAAGFWIRRELDGTAGEVEGALDELLAAYDPDARALAGVVVELLGSAMRVEAASKALAGTGAVFYRGPADAFWAREPGVYCAPGFERRASAAAARAGIAGTPPRKVTWRTGADVVLVLGPGSTASRPGETR